MSNNSIMQLKLDILSDISENLNGSLHSEKYGLALKHGCGTIRWVQMDRQTCALIFDIQPEMNLSFQPIGMFSNSVYHSINVQKGSIEFSGFGHKESFNLMPYESLFFHNLESHPSVNLKKGKKCRLIWLSESFGPNTNHIWSANSSLLHSILKNEESLVLNRIFEAESDSISFKTIKGLLFLLLSVTIPESCIENTNEDLESDFFEKNH